MAFEEEQDDETATQTQTQISIHESRFEKMVSPFDTKPAFRLANFLNPLSKNPHKAKTFLPNTPFLSEIFPHDLHQWPSKVIFRGWYGPLKKWKQWVDQLSPKFSPIWKQAGIHQAIMASVYDLSPNPDTVLGLSEFWCSETNTFIFPWGEATITLEDVFILGGYPVLGDPVTGGSPVLNHEMVNLEEKFKNYRLKNLKKKGIKATHHGWLNYFMEEKRESRDDVVHIAFLSVWLSRFVFPSIAAKHILISLIPIAVRLSHGVKLALGPAVLASLYHNLTIIREEALASRDKINVSGPFQLLQIWVCERFPVIGPKPADLLLPGLPRMARWDKLNLKLTLPLVRLAVKEAKNFCWRPYAAKLKNWCYHKEKEQLFSDCSGLEDDLRSFHRFLLVSYVVGMDCKEKYFPHRVAMQFGLDQDIPSHLLSVSLGSREPGQLFVPSRSFQPCVTLRYSDWWKGLILTRQEKSKNTKNGHLVSSSMQASGNSQDDHGKGAAAKPFDSDSESSMESRSQNHPFKVSPEVPCEDKTRANNDHVVREEWNKADAGRFQDFPSTPTILKGSSCTISPPPGFHGLSSNAKKRLVHEFINTEGDGPASLPCDKKTKVAETGKEPPVPIQAGICKTGISNANLVKVEYTSDGDGDGDDDDVVIISHLDTESNKCSSRKEKLSGRESFKVSETPNNFKISSEVNAEEKTEPVKRHAKNACDFVTEAGGFHRKVKVEPGNSANEPFGNTKIRNDSSKEHGASVWGMAGECASNPINLDEDTTSSASVNTKEDVEKRLQKLEKMLGLV